MKYWKADADWPYIPPGITTGSQFPLFKTFLIWFVIRPLNASRTSQFGGFCSAEMCLFHTTFPYHSHPTLQQLTSHPILRLVSDDYVFCKFLFERNISFQYNIGWSIFPSSVTYLHKRLLFVFHRHLRSFLSPEFSCLW